jgi:pyruvate carboxylase
MHRQSTAYIASFIYQVDGTDDSVHIEADEAYVIGKRGQYTPVGAYLAADEIVKIALQHDVNMIHPGKSTEFTDVPSKCRMALTISGYGFLSENAEFARKVEKAGLIVSMPKSNIKNKTVDML